MSVANIHSRYAIQLDTQSPSVPVMLGGVTSQNLANNNDIRGMKTDGGIYQEFIALHGQAPAGSFGTVSIKRALDEIGLLGHKIANNGANFYAQKWVEGSTPDTDPTHTRYNVREGVIVPRTLSVDHRGNASLSYDVLVTYDGTNDPIVTTHNVALPTDDAPEDRWTLAQATVGSLVIGQLTNLSVEFGVDARTIGANSDVWDTFAQIRGVTPSISLSGTDIQTLGGAKIPNTGQAMTHANTTFILRKRAGKSTFVDPATAEHISFTADGMAVVETIFSDNGDEPASVSVNMPLRFDGVNVPIVFNTAASY